MDIKESDFEEFKVYSLDNTHTFFHINLSEESFFENISEFILNEDNFLQFIENNTSIKFHPNEKNYAKLYRQLDKFIDDDVADYIELNIADSVIKDIIIEENPKYKQENGKIKIKLSKVGRLGEYIFHLILSKYFKFTCIIPKISLTTNKNMSVFGIDALFLANDTRMLLFGESKVTKNLSNGIKLINKSLKDYEKSVRDEFLLTINEEQIKRAGLVEAFGDLHENCISFDEFKERSEIESIGVPLFIVHGNEVDFAEIIQKLKKEISEQDFFGLETKYYIISLPVISKSDFIKNLTISVKKKMEEYDELRKQV